MTPVVDIDWLTTVMITAPVSCTSLGFDCVLTSARPIAAVYRGCRLGRYYQWPIISTKSRRMPRELIDKPQANSGIPWIECRRRPAGIDGPVAIHARQGPDRTDMEHC